MDGWMDERMDEKTTITLPLNIPAPHYFYKPPYTTPVTHLVHTLYVFMYKCLYVYMYGLKKIGRLKNHMYGWTDVWMDVLMHGCMDVWMYGV